MRYLKLGSVALLLLLGTTGCGSLDSLPLPFGSDPTPTPVAQATSTPAPVAVETPAPPQTPTPPSFQPFWVQNHEVTDMWSGPAGEQGVVSFGPTSSQFCSFQVVLPQSNDRLYVFNPYSQNYFWIDASAIGPVGEPPRQAGPKPDGQNCAQAIYEG